ncbi:3-methyl-2-oxobutanoate hydroxymethyltransferase [Phycisphaerales bacterium]|nr:3-methyl-2-oxobutanoate hydroxymethyltransferase [Phycisphaerales bacterium]
MSGVSGSYYGPVTTPKRDSVTIRTIRKMVRDGQPFACLTCYDATTARWLERAGVHVLLVGDTAAEVILGYSRTIDMPLEIAVALTGAVKRGAPRALVMADMPFMSYQADAAEAVRNAGRFMTEGLADVVKVEADQSHAEVIGRMARAGVPVCAHVGSRPQLAGLQGGYSGAGRTPKEAAKVVEDAVVLEKSGAVMLLVEAVPAEVTDEIMRATTVPLIGIGAGPACHGQVLVLQDLVGMTDEPPRFAEGVAKIGPALQAAGEEWVRRVAERRIGGAGYEMKAGGSIRAAGGGEQKRGVPGGRE